jgi:hypothetical protein
MLCTKIALQVFIFDTAETPNSKKAVKTRMQLWLVLLLAKNGSPLIYSLGVCRVCAVWLFGVCELDLRLICTFALAALGFLGVYTAVFLNLECC